MDTRRHMNRMAAYMILIKDDKVLLGLRQNTGWKDNVYAFPAGHIEKDESFSMALIREAKEEIGLDIKEENFEIIHMSHRRSDENDYVDAYFLVKNWEGEPINAEPEVCGGLEWFDLDDLPDNLVEYERIILGKIKDKIFYSELYWDTK